MDWQEGDDGVQGRTADGMVSAEWWMAFSTLRQLKRDLCGPLNNILPMSTLSLSLSLSLSQMDAHEELYSMADDVFESPPMSASYGDHHEPYQSL